MTGTGERTNNIFKSILRMAAVCLLCFMAQNASAADIPRQEADQFGKLLVQTTSGRIGPINTYSSEILRKIYHRDHYGAYTSDQMLLAMMSDPAKWSETPIIYLSDKGLRERFGGEGKHISYESLFDQEGKYVLLPEMEQIYAKAPNERNKTDKELIKLDEKVSILYSLFTGGMMKLFPHDNGKWYSAGDALDSLSGKDSLFIAKGMPWYLSAINEGDAAEAAQIRDMISTYQKAKIPQGLISDTHVKAELFYNKADIFRWAFRLYLILGFALLITAFTGAKEGFVKKLALGLTLTITAVFLWQTFGMGLRWYISGRAPWTDTYETMVYVGWTTVLAGLIFARRSPLVLALGTLMGGVILFVSNLNWLDPQITPLVPVLKSYWLMIHVSVVTASYGFFGICAVTGLTSLILLLGGRINCDLRKINEMAMIIGLVLLTIGIFFGAVWANESWGRYWGWDPKETWALITMIVYAFITHSRFIPALNNYFAFSAMSVVAIASVLMTFFGVNYYLSGLHSYGTGGAISSAPVMIVAGIILLLIFAAGIKYRALKK